MGGRDLQAMIHVLARRAGLAVVLACLSSVLLASRADALPGLGLAPRGPALGLQVPLACANPANSGSTGSVLGAAPVVVVGQMRGSSQPIGYQRGSNGPKIRSGSTGLGQAQ